MKRLLPIILALAFAPPAHARGYQVYGCDGPDGRARSMLPFVDFEVPLSSMNHDDHCQQGDNVAYFEWAPGMTLAAGQRGGWRLDAPAGSTIAQLSWRGATTGIGPASGVRTEIARGDDGAVLWDFSTDLGLDQRGFMLPPGTTTLVLRQACRAALCTTATMPARTWIWSISATLADDSPPTARAFEGTLAAPGARHGGAGLTFAAADAGSGLARAALVVDGAAHTVTLDASASCTPVPGDPNGFESPQPCRRTAPVELAWATSGVRDGAHRVSATLEDASGNVSTVFGPTTVTTDNAPPVAGTVTVAGTRRAGEALTATAAGFDGQDVAYAYRWQRCTPECDDIEGATRARYVLASSDVGARVRAEVTATDLGGTATVRSDILAGDAIAAAPAPTATATPTPTATPAPAAPAPAPVTAPGAQKPAPRVTLSRRTIKLAYGRRVEIRGRVTDAHGTPLAGATLDVAAKVRTPRAKERREGGIGTARDGRFTYVAPAGASRDLKIGTRTVTLLVRAAGTFTATRKGRVVTLSGRLRGGHIPRGGVLVELTANGRTLRLVRTNGRGAFKALVAAGPAKRSFRAVARKDSSWPFVPALVGSPASA